MDKVFGYACIRHEDEKLDYQINLLKIEGIKKRIFSLMKKAKIKKIIQTIMR